MKKMINKVLAATLCASMLCSGISPYCHAEANVISQDELEELKRLLEEEIANYYELERQFELTQVDEESIFDSFLSFVTSSAAVGGKSKALTNTAPGMVTEEYCLEEVAYTDSYECDMPYVEAPMYAFNTEEYGVVKERGFTNVATDPLSTFAADVDTGSYCNLRRMLRSGYAFSDIPSGAIRTEELLNYFDYTVDEQNISDGKFSLQYELASCPWNTDSELLLMTLQANTVEM